ncbi:helix-turn-helix domain-containing protein [Arcanobacterium phocae]|uniref:helix-turn-helix domain-containing protein n=1 Tax=Arcanobacterium phocae TaxID=131112 RepID=UPI001C0EFDD3|nr:helix-turn-helix domain-containing protein [Arcanobacterium phocae]
MTTTIESTQVSLHDIQQLQDLAEKLDSEYLTPILYSIITAIQNGEDLTFITKDKELTPNEVADFLQVSRPHVVKLMNKGFLKYRTVGTHRRITLPDLLDYIQRHEKANSHVQHLLATREQMRNDFIDAECGLTSDDLADLSELAKSPVC